MSTIGDHFRAMTENYPSASKATTPDLAALVADLRFKAERAAKIAPGQWDSDIEKGEGEYGIGDDTREGFFVPYVFTEGDKRLFDAHTSDVAEVHEEWDGDEDGTYCTATDEASVAILNYTVAAQPSNIIALLDAYAEQTEKLELLTLALREAGEVERAGEAVISTSETLIADQAATIAALTAEVERLEAALNEIRSHKHYADRVNNNAGDLALLECCKIARNALTTQGEG